MAPNAPNFPKCEPAKIFGGKQISFHKEQDRVRTGGFVVAWKGARHARIRLLKVWRSSGAP